MKKYLWILVALALATLLIWKFLKPDIYEIKTDEKPVIGEMLYGELLADSGIYKVPASEWDSITCSDGLSMKNINTKELLVKRKQYALPLELISMWKNGIAYKQLFKSPEYINKGKSVIAPDYGKLMFPLVSDTSKYIGVFKENFDENSVTLRLEKKHPKRIVSMWENYAINGFTDGENIKLNIPSNAAVKDRSLIRVWVCDEHNNSSVCEIPLQDGHVINKMDLVTSHDKMLRNTLFSRIRNASDIALDPVWEVRTEQWINLMLKDAALVPVLLYGDYRGIEINKDCVAMVSSYFGNKIIFIFNSGQTLVRTSIPMKGELKQAMGGSNFNLVKNRLEVTMKPKSIEIIY